MGSKLKSIKVTPEDFIAARDRRENSRDTARCKGGRIILNGYTCPFCGHMNPMDRDESRPDYEPCGYPLSKAIEELEDEVSQ